MSATVAAFSAGVLAGFFLALYCAWPAMRHFERCPLAEDET